jgi:hypothetical protein
MTKYDKACAYYNYCSEWIQDDQVKEFEVDGPLMGGESYALYINTDFGPLRIHEDDIDYGADRYDEDPNKYTDNA